MCGIFGFWKTSILSNEDISFGIKCLDQLSHRGPDDDGIWSSKKHKIFLDIKDYQLLILIKGQDNLLNIETLFLILMERFIIIKK